MKTAPRIAVVVGTRAQLIKVAPVMRLLEQRGISYWFVFTAQHRETIDAIRANFGIKAPDCTLAAGPSEAKTIRLFGGWAWRAFWALWFRRRALIPFCGGIVLNHGEIIEQGSASDVIHHPKAGYTRELLDAIPNPFSASRVA